MYYSIWKNNECKGAAFGTELAVNNWATANWGYGCSLEVITEEQANQISRAF